jgi:hypothetical protein
MLKEIVDNFKKKSLKERFLLVMGMLFFFPLFNIGTHFYILEAYANYDATKL